MRNLFDNYHCFSVSEWFFECCLLICSLVYVRNLLKYKLNDTPHPLLTISTPPSFPSRFPKKVHIKMYVFYSNTYPFRRLFVSDGESSCISHFYSFLFSLRPYEIRILSRGPPSYPGRQWVFRFVTIGYPHPPFSFSFPKTWDIHKRGHHSSSLFSVFCSSFSAQQVESWGWCARPCLKDWISAKWLVVHRISFSELTFCLF